MNPKPSLIEVLIVIAIVGIIAALFLGGGNHSRLMDDCIRDGHKEYECVSMLRGRAR